MPGFTSAASAQDSWFASTTDTKSDFETATSDSSDSTIAAEEPVLQPLDRVESSEEEPREEASARAADHPDYQPLVDLYNSTNGPSWRTRQGWLTNTNPCNGWYGVECTDGRVTQINLSSNQLTGTLPASLGSLARLRRLLLAQNYLSGSIPSSLGSLASLEWLFLGNNALSGSIPSSLGSLASLQQLSLDYNSLSGSIPTTIGLLTKVEILYLNNNKLSGSIPSTLGSLTRLRNLFLNNNELSGGIPSGLGSLASLVNLYLNNNQLTSIPSSFEYLTKLVRIELENNQLTSIPVALGNMTQLQTLDLSYNQISGPIPSFLGNLINLEELFLRGNRLSGSIPSSLGKLTKLGNLLLNDNQLSGCFPASLTALCGANYNVGGNEGLPPFSSFCTLGWGRDDYVPIATASASSVPVGSQVNLSTAGGYRDYIWSASDGAQLNGVYNNAVSATMLTPGVKTFTVEVVHGGTCSQTARVSVTATAVAPTISGFAPTTATVCPGSVASFSATVGNVTGSYAYTLTNGSNPVTGTASTPAFSQTLVTAGSGSQNFTLTVSTSGGSVRATTTLTVSLGGHPDFQALLDLYNNTNGPGWGNKSGWFSNCDPCNGWNGVECEGGNGRVTHLSLSQNQLKGTLPVSIGSLTNLTYLNLAFNELTGSIPSSIGNLTGLTDLYLYNNQLTGSIPSSLGSLAKLQKLALSNNQLTGNLPVSLGSLSNLDDLRIATNQLTGSIPATMGSLVKLQTLYLQENQLTGSIPSSLGSLTKLKYLFLQNNQLTGSIPSSLGSLSSMQFLHLGDNKLSGCFPASLKALCHVELNFIGNANLPGGGSSTARSNLCTTGQGSDDFVPTANASSSSTAIGGVVSLSTSGGYSYSWKAPAGAVLSSTNTKVVSATLTSAGAYTFTVVVGQGTNCSQTATVSVNAMVVTPTITGFTPSLSSVCVGSATTFTATVGNVTGSYSYTLTNGADINRQGSSSSPTFSQTVTVDNPVSSQSFTLRVSSGGGSRSATASLTVNALPTATITPSSAILSCANPSVVLTASGGSTYRWEDNSTNAVRTITTAGTYSVTVTSGNGCSASKTVTVSGNSTIPTATITPSSATLSCANPSVVLTASGGSTYRWEDNSTNAVRTITTAGTYSVTVTSGNGCSASKTVTVSGNSTIPTATITPSSATLSCANPSAVLTASGGDSYRWEDNSTNATRTITTAGTYSVTVTSGNGCSASKTVTVSGNTTAPTATITPSSATLSCANPSAVLTASGGESYRWEDNSTNATRTITTAGTYSVTVTSGNGCSAVKSVTVSGTTTAPTATITPSSATLSCANPSVVLTASGGESYRWEDNSTNAVRTITTAGTYSVTVTNGNGCSSVKTVTVSGNSTAPTATITPSSATLSCANPSVVLTASGGDSYRWEDNSTIATRTITTAGTYSVTVTNGNGCSSVKTVTVSGNSTAPTATITPSSATLSCANPSVVLTASGGESYRWEDNSTNAVRTITTAGTYSVTVTNGNGCSSVKTVTVSGNSTAPTATITPSSATLSCANSSVVLTASGGASYRWEDNSTNAIRTITTAGTYSVTVTSGNGCSASKSVTVSGNLTIPTPPNLTSTTVTQGSPTVTLTASNCAGTVTWNGPGGSSGTGALFVPTTEPGTFVYQATCTIGDCVSDPSSVSVVITGPTVTGSFDGFIYGADCSTFRGWVWDRNKPNAAISIDILDNSTVVATLLADQFRTDLLNAGKGNGKHAFTWPIPDNLKDGQTHRLSAQVTGNGFTLKDSPKAIVCQRSSAPVENQPPKAPTTLIPPLVAQVGVQFAATLAAFTDPEGGTLTYRLDGLPDALDLNPTSRVISGIPSQAGTFILVYQATDELGATNSVSFNLTVNPAQTTTVTGSFDGYLDKVECGTIRGWVWDRNKPNTPLTVEFYTDGTVWGSVVANIYRDDLKNAGKGNGAHAYSFTVPTELKDGTTRLIRARVSGSTYDLKDSGKPLTCAPAPARLSAEINAGLEVTVLGNPVTDLLRFEVKGAEGQAVQWHLADESGRLVSQHQIGAARPTERQSLAIGQQPAGVYFLRVQSGPKSVTLKVQKP